MTISHVSIPTGQKHFKKMRDFYLTILAPLGYKIFMEKEGEVVGFGPKYGAPDFWIHCGGEDIELFDGDLERRKGKAHVCFDVSSTKAVHEWYENAIKAGAISNGAPGERPQYVKGYYAAFVIDPLGNNIEVITWTRLLFKVLSKMPLIITGVAGAGLAVGATYFLK